VGEEAFSVIREAMVKSDMRAISRVVLNHRERAVLLEPRDKGMVLWTLRYGDEVRDEGAADLDRFAAMRSRKPRRHKHRRENPPLDHAALRICQARSPPACRQNDRSACPGGRRC
jgi:hypothetical protein